MQALLFNVKNGTHSQRLLGLAAHVAGDDDGVKGACLRLQPLPHQHDVSIILASSPAQKHARLASR